MKLGFIGLGIMGKPMAANLLKAGNTLNVFNRSRDPVDELIRLGAVERFNPKEVALSSDVILLMLPDSPDVEQVVTGENGIAEGLSPGKIVVDMSSIDPAVSQRLAQRLLDQGVFMLDAPVSGGEIGAMNGELAIMVGGDAQTFEKVKPILQALGRKVTLVGGHGAGNAVKLINQIIVAINIAGVSEAMSLGKRAGLDLAIVYEAIKSGLAGSRVMDTKMANLIQEQYSPGFRVKLHRKDLNNAIRLSQKLGASLPFTTTIFELFGQLSEMGYESEDHSALYRLFLSASVTPKTAGKRDRE